MKVNLSVATIKNTTNFLSKRVETKDSKASEHAGNSDYVTNSLDALAASGKSMITSSKTVDPIAKDILERFNDVVQTFEKNSKPDEYTINREGLKKDIEILKKPGHLIDNYVPIFNNSDDALKSANVGDVFHMKGEQTVSIKNKAGKIEKLSMSRKSYLKLFPPLERFINIQTKEFGNCYEITALNAVMERPYTRENLLRCIDTESKKGIIRVKFNGKNKE